MTRRPVSLILSSFDDAEGFDTALSHAIMEQVADGETGETFRVSIPGPTLAFGRRDRAAPGFGRAVDVAERLGYSPVVRLAGGRAVAFHEQTVSLSWTVPVDDPLSGTRDRFAFVADTLLAALRRLGMTGHLGELPGEYCPGAFTISHRRRRKVAGIGQRVIRGAAHVAAVVVVSGAERISEVLVPVYDALDLPLDPMTIGAVDDVVAGVVAADVASALVATIGEDTAPTIVRPPASTPERARRLPAGHSPARPLLA